MDEMVGTRIRAPALALAFPLGLPLPLPLGLPLPLVLVLVLGQARAADDPLVQPSLVAASASIRPGGEVVVGVRLRLAPGWHVYWINPGDAGTAVQVGWDLPEGFAAGALEWPVPSRFEAGGIASYGYSGEPVLLATLRAPASAAPGTRARIAARLDWLVCSEESCIPGEATVSLDLEVAAAEPHPSAEAPILDAARARLPRAPAGLRATIVAQDDETIVLRVEPPADLPLDGRTAAAGLFFPEREGLIEAAEEQAVRPVAGGAVEITLPRTSIVKGRVAEVRGVLRVKRLQPTTEEFGVALGADAIDTGRKGQEKQERAR